MSSKPLVSVLLPVFNCERSVYKAVESILNQSYQNFEIIVIDDHSSDSSRKIIENIRDSRIRIYANPENLRLSATLNKGMALCKGKYVARMDADDYSCPNRFEAQVAFLEENPDYLLVGSSYIKEVDGEIKGLRKQVRRYQTLKSKLLFGNNICHPSVMFNKEKWFSNNLSYCENYVYAQDYDLWTRAILTCKMANLAEPLVIYTKDTSISNPEKSKLAELNYKRSTINYIQSIFKDVSLIETNHLYQFFRRPNELSFGTAFRMYLKSIAMCFQPKEFDRIDFLLRVNNQLLKNVFQ
jgi:glycosyltransferase involved in cell wall biosynthesis